MTEYISIKFFNKTVYKQWACFLPRRSNDKGINLFHPQSQKKSASWREFQRCGSMEPKPTWVPTSVHKMQIGSYIEIIFQT